MITEEIFDKLYSFSSDLVVLFNSSGKVLKFNEITKKFFHNYSNVQDIVNKINIDSNSKGNIKFNIGNDQHQFVYQTIKFENGLNLLMLKTVLNNLDFYNRIFPNIPVAIVVYDKDGNIRCWNNHFLEMWGITEREIENYNVFFDDKLKSLGLLEKINEVFQGKPLLFIEGYYDSLLEKGKGYKIWIDSTLFPLMNENNEVENVVAIYNDISEVKLAQEEIKIARASAEEANRLKNAFMENLSHEIRTPLNSIIGFSDLISELVKNQLSQEDFELIENFRKGINRLYRTLTQILELSQIDTGSYEIKIEPVDIANEIKKVKEEFESEANSKGLDFLINLDDNYRIVLADKPALDKVLRNLVENAIKFTNSGYIKIESNVNDTKNLLFVFIKDTGIGMSEEYLDHIFEPFSQEETGYSRPFEGTGLGLALAKRYLDLMNGTITVNSVKGVGTTFTFTLPIYTQKI